MHTCLHTCLQGKPYQYNPATSNYWYNENYGKVRSCWRNCFCGGASLAPLSTPSVGALTLPAGLCWCCRATTLRVCATPPALWLRCTRPDTKPARRCVLLTLSGCFASGCALDAWRNTCVCTASCCTQDACKPKEEGEKGKGKGKYGKVRRSRPLACAHACPPALPVL